MPTVIAYIDGFNLYHGLHEKYRRRYLWLDLPRLVQRLRPRDHVVRVRYFTALVQGEQQALVRQQEYLGALRAHGGTAIDVVLGRYQHKTLTCRQCGNTWSSYTPTQHAGRTPSPGQLWRRGPRRGAV